ncbi:hypothetical protein T439DRAFT_324686 [Meredithblackwellia eburnea MCA 4105]
MWKRASSLFKKRKSVDHQPDSVSGTLRAKISVDSFNVPYLCSAFSDYSNSSDSICTLEDSTGLEWVSHSIDSQPKYAHEQFPNHSSDSSISTHTLALDELNDQLDSVVSVLNRTWDELNGTVEQLNMTKTERDRAKDELTRTRLELQRSREQAAEWKAMAAAEKNQREQLANDARHLNSYLKRMLLRPRSASFPLDHRVDSRSSSQSV